MAFRSGVFTSTSVTVNGDGIPVGNKAITAADFAKRFYHIYGDGISLKPTSAFYVTPKSGLIATVAAGWGMMSGYDFEETADYNITMTSSVSDQTLYIGVRLDVATGEFTGNHVAARTTFVAATDRVFAIIVIPANAVTLTTAMITDTRYSATYCGTIDAERVALAALATEYEEALETLTETGVPVHATTHGSAGSDAITPSAIGAQAAMTANVDYVAPIALALIGSYGIYSGGEVTAQSTPNQTVAVSSGGVITAEGKRYTFSAVSALSATAANATNPRIDIVYVSSSGVVTYLAGTAAASPSQPATPSNGTVLCSVYRAANDNTIATGDITDQRDFISAPSDSEDVTAVTENSNSFACDFAKKHTKNFSLRITNTTAKTVTFTNIPYGTCDTIIAIKATGTAAVTWTLDGRSIEWTGGAPTLTTGYTYLILFTWVSVLGKWIGMAMTGAAN